MWLGFRGGLRADGEGFYRQRGMAEGLGFNPIGEESGRITLGGLRVRPVLFGRDDMWGPGVSGWREGGRYRFGKEGKRAAGGFCCWAGSCPRGPFSFPYFTFSFLFVFALKFV
jgi:hypothetical protein